MNLHLHLLLGPIVALIAGILILVVPRLLNYIVAIYLIIIGLVGLSAPAACTPDRVYRHAAAAAVGPLNGSLSPPPTRAPIGSSVVGRPLVLRRAYGGVRLRCIDAGGQRSDLRPQRLDVPVLPKNDITQFSVRTLQVGDLGL